jgi:hypothetical protein
LKPTELEAVEKSRAINFWTRTLLHRGMKVVTHSLKFSSVTTPINLKTETSKPQQNLPREPLPTTAVLAKDSDPAIASEKQGTNLVAIQNLLKMENKS